MKSSYANALKDLDPEYRKILKRIPKKSMHPRLPSDWLHWQVLERFAVLKYADIHEGMTILEVGCGPHAIATMALAALVGEKGRVLALDIGRWKDFWIIAKESSIAFRIIPIQEDARELPFPFPCFDLVTCVHGVRSFDSRESILKVMKEMLRVTKERIFIAESSPIAKTKAQEAHLAMYNLRHSIFSALGHPEYGGIHYLTPEELRTIAKEAGAKKIVMDIIDVRMPHHLAYLPLDYIRRIKNKTIREDLEKKWHQALRMLDEYGEEHPPVILITCWK